MLSNLIRSACRLSPFEGGALCVIGIVVGVVAWKAGMASLFTLLVSYWLTPKVIAMTKQRGEFLGGVAFGIGTIIGITGMSIHWRRQHNFTTLVQADTLLIMFSLMLGTMFLASCAAVTIRRFGSKRNGQANTPAAHPPQRGA